MSDGGSTTPPSQPPGPPPGAPPQPWAPGPTPGPQGGPPPPAGGPPPGWQGPPAAPGGPPPGYPQRPPQPTYPQPSAPGGYQPPGAQPAPGWGAPTNTPAAFPSAPRQPSALAAASPAVLASLAISIGVIVMFVASLLQGLGLGKGVPGKNKLLQFLAPADLAVAAALILAVALVVFSARKAEASNGASAAPPTSGAQNLAALVAGVVAVLAIVRAITDLTVAHQTGAYKFGGFVDGLAAALVAAAAARWGLKANQK